MHWFKRFRWRFGHARMVRAQVRSGYLPEVRATFERLRQTGHSARQVYRLLAAVYEAEVATMLIEDRLWDRSAYFRGLDALPTRPTVSLDDVRRAGRRNIRCS